MCIQYREELSLGGEMDRTRSLWFTYRAIIIKYVKIHKFITSLKEQYPEKKAVGRPRLQYLKQVDRNKGADSCRAMEIMACNNSR
jgi:hypothetical protein